MGRETQACFEIELIWNFFWFGSKLEIDDGLLILGSEVFFFSLFFVYCFLSLVLKTFFENLF